jgi:hypothetical protein
MGKCLSGFRRACRGCGSTARLSYSGICAVARGEMVLSWECEAASLSSLSGRRSTCHEIVRLGEVVTVQGVFV